LAAGKVQQGQQGDEYPHCLIEINGKPLLETIVQNTSSIHGANYNFVFLKDEAQQYHLDNIAKLLVADAECTHVSKQTKGSACTALLATSFMDQDAELLIISANELVNISMGDMLEKYREKSYDAGTLIFHSIHPRYSYVRLNDLNLVVETTQRDPITTHATAGIFWYRNTSDFIEGAKNLIRKNAHVGGAYFVAPVFNELVLKHKKIGVMKLAEDDYTPLKTSWSQESQSIRETNGA
jgi:dTDP-glucose pyrophosphorylase